MIPLGSACRSRPELSFLERIFSRSIVFVPAELAPDPRHLGCGKSKIGRRKRKLLPYSDGSNVEKKSYEKLRATTHGVIPAAKSPVAMYS